MSARRGRAARTGQGAVLTQIKACAEGRREVALDPKGFILTGREAGCGERDGLETSQPGVFALGDIRAGSTKRVSAAVGDGAQVIGAIHSLLAAGGRAPASVI